MLHYIRTKACGFWDFFLEVSLILNLSLSETSLTNGAYELPLCLLEREAIVRL